MPTCARAQLPRPAPAQAAATFGAPAAAYSGAGGLQLDIAAVSTTSWHIQLMSANFEPFIGRLYTFCVWARIASATPANMTTWLTFENVRTYSW
jgi:hypothetical protein